MSAIQILKTEHEQILQMIEVSKVMLSSENSDNFDVADLEKVIDFIQNFADKYHHMKEEDELFFEMGKHGFSPESGPVAVMLHEHNLGRLYIRQTLEAVSQFKSGNSGAMDDIRENLLNYAGLLTGHIQKENNILYPMAENILPEEILVKMQHSFEQKNTTTSENEYHDKYLRTAKELSDKYL